jgi:Rrf2 family transcriptional regulator, iron-sulfur cluster assembly transcription factor
MIFSKAIEYGIKASIYVAQQSMNGYRSNLKEISGHIDSPEAFTAKILQQLAKAEIIDSIKGAGGGFTVDLKGMRKIKLLDIVLALDASFLDRTCLLGLKQCSETNPCPVHHKYKDIKKETMHLLKSTSLFEMSTNLDKGLAYLRN